MNAHQVGRGRWRFFKRAKGEWRIANNCSLFPYSPFAIRHSRSKLVAVLPNALNQRHRARRRANFALVYHVGEHVARRGFGLMRGIDARQIVGRPALRPLKEPLRPGVEFARRIGGRHRVLAALQPRIDEIAGKVGNVRIADVVRVDRRQRKLPQQCNKFRRAKTVVADLDHVAQFLAAEFLRQQLQKAAEIGGIEFLGRRELPEQGTQMRAELGHAGIEKALDRVAGLFEHAPVHRIARPLDREHEPCRHLARPRSESFWRLGPVERAVDLDRGQPLGRVMQLLRMRQTFRIKHAAPRLERPAADADADSALCRGHVAVIRACYTMAPSGGGAGYCTSPPPRRPRWKRATPDERAPRSRGRFRFLLILPRDSGGGGPREARWRGCGTRRNSCHESEASSPAPLPPSCFARWSPFPAALRFAGKDEKEKARDRSRASFLFVPVGRIRNPCRRRNRSRLLPTSIT